MRMSSRIVEALFVVGLVYVTAMTACAGIDVEVGPIGLHSGKVIVPGMIAWFFGLLAGALRWRTTRTPPAPEDPLPERPGALLAGAWLAASLLCLLALARGIGRPFFQDDLIMVRSAAILTPSGIPALFTGHSWSTPGFIRPLPELLWWLEYHVHGCTPLACHLLNLAVHLANVLLVGVVARQLIGDARLAAGAMAIFAVCGTHAEPLLWLASRYDLVATFWVLAAVAAFLADRVALSFACTVLALFSKEAALTLPLGIAFLEIVRRRTIFPRAALPHLALLAAYLAYRFHVLGAITSTSAHGDAWVGVDKLLELPLAVLPPLAWPFNIEQLADLAAPARLAAGLGLAVAPLLAVRRLAAGPDRATVLAYGLLVVATVPVHNVISFSATLRQSRYAYLPAAFYAIALAACARALPVRRATALLALLAACHFALLRGNAEPFVAAGATVARLHEQSAPVLEALSAGATVSLAGLPLAYRGTPVAGGHTLLDPLCERAHVPADRLWIEGEDWRGAAPPPTVRFTWTPEQGFRKVN